MYVCVCGFISVCSPLSAGVVFLAPVSESESHSDVSALGLGLAGAFLGLGVESVAFLDAAHKHIESHIEIFTDRRTLKTAVTCKCLLKGTLKKIKSS